MAPRLLASTSSLSMMTSPSPEATCTEAATLFFTDANLKISPTSGGVNNVVQYVEDSSGKRYILRVYNNGLNSVRVKWEHDILSKLKGKQLSFSIPTMLPALATGETHVKLSSGAEACAMDLIPGTLPKLTAVEDIGRASGELCTALADVAVDAAASPNPPYFELFKVHHAVTREAFFEVMKGPEFNGCRAAATELVAAIVDMEEKIKSSQYMSLPKQVRVINHANQAAEKNLRPSIPPHQLIHGDLHYDNVLVENGHVTGLLDFEFCAYDWRAMELAVCLSKYAGEKEALQYFDTFVTGFAKHGRLTEARLPRLLSSPFVSSACGPPGGIPRSRAPL